MATGDDTASNGTGDSTSRLPDSRRLADLYWRNMEQLKAAAVCMRLTRNRLARRVKTVEIIKAVASSGAIARWFATDSYKIVWGVIMAAAQLLDVLKDIFPFAKLHKQATAMTVALETLFIDAEDEWEKIYIGKPNEQTIIARLTRLKKLQLETEAKHFPEGFEPAKNLVDLAAKETETYFLVTHAVEVKS